MQKSSVFLEKDSKINMLKIKNIMHLETIVFIQMNIEVLHIAYDYRFIIKEVAEEFKGRCTCLVENTENKEKELKTIDENG